MACLHSSDYVHALDKQVEASYSQALFEKFPLPNGTTMNIALDIPKCELYVKKLEAVVQLTRRRLEHLSTGSLRCFGPILRDRVVVVLNLSGVSEHTAASYRAVLDLYLASQVARIKAFNIIRSGVYTSYKWMDVLQDVSDDALDRARAWVASIGPLESADGAGLPDAADALQFALGQGADAIHFVRFDAASMHSLYTYCRHRLPTRNAPEA